MSYPQIDCSSFPDVLTTITVTYFVLYVSEIILERKCGHMVSIYTHDSIQQMPNAAVRLRLTKRFDKYGTYRIQTKISIYVLKIIFKVLECINLSLVIILYPDYIVDHFVYMKPETKNLTLMLHGVAVLFSFYLWEISTNRYYYKLNKAFLLHHWVSIFACLLVLHGNFSPFASWYAIMGIFVTFPFDIIFYARIKYGSDYSMYIQKGFKCMFWFNLSLIIIIVAGHAYLLYNAYFGYGKGQFSIYYGIVIIFGICCLIYDDVVVLKYFRQFAKLDYSDTAFDSYERETKI